MAKRKITEKSSVNAVIERVDNRKDRISTKILIGLAIACMFALLGYGIKGFMDCGLNNCYLGGVGIGSVVATVVALVVNSIKP